MFELIARLLASAAILASPLAVKQLNFDLAWKTAAVFASYSLVLTLLERRDLRTASVSAGAAIFDAACIATVLAQAGVQETFGWLVLAPVFWASIKHGANPALIGPLAAGVGLAVANLFPAGITLSLGIQAALIGAMGLLAGQNRQVIRVSSDAEPTHPAHQQEDDDFEFTPATDPVPMEFFELRENFRALKDHAEDLERKGRRDRATSQLVTAYFEATEGPYAAIARKLCELTNAEGLTLYTISQLGSRMVVRSISGDVPDRLETASFEAPSGLGDGQIRHKVETLINSLKTGEEVRPHEVRLLKVKGRVVGMIAVFHHNQATLEESLRKADATLEIAGQLVWLQIERDEMARRLGEAELLYTVASTTSGSDTPSTLANRVVRELNETLDVDHLGVFLLDGEEAKLSCSAGRDVRTIDSMSFANGPGIKGWRSVGMPELDLLDAHSDMRLETSDAIRQRVGSYVVIPFGAGDEPDGFLTAATQRVNGIDAGALETLRIIAAEMGQAMSRIGKVVREPEGLATPKEIHEAIKSGTGCLVYLEVLKRAELESRFGAPPIQMAIRKFANRIRAKLPSGGLLCRRDEGDYVAFLKTTDVNAATSWANEAIATASLIGISTPDGKSRIPLSLRAKAAPVGVPTASPAQDSNLKEETHAATA